MKTYHLTTFGCQMNEHDSERMKGMLESLGYRESPDRDGSDLILFNTCSIRESADNRLIGNLGEAKRLKSEDPARIVGVGGCWSQSMKDRVFEQFPFVDVAFGPGQIGKLGEFLCSDDLSAQGYFEFESFPGHLPMNRDRYMKRVEMIRSYVPDCAITTDIIVGFPGETEADFRETLEVVDEVGYDSAFTFIFSPRRGTEAAELPDQIPHSVKRERMERLVELVQRRASEQSARFVGRELEVLVEGPSRTDPAKLRGRTRHNKTVNFEGLAQPGDLAQVQITGATSTTLAGEEVLLARVG